MKIRLLSLFVFITSMAHVIAQETIYDPLLDPNAVIIPKQTQEIWESTYMWYPGQLAAYYQQQCKEISKKRCVNVGYPGKFFAKTNRVYFRKNVNLKETETLKWAGPSAITLYVNGEKQTTPKNTITLKPGKTSLVFEVITKGVLPCIIIEGNQDIKKLNGWQTSMDQLYWTIPESAPMYNKPNIPPDSPQDITVKIKPKHIYPLRNSLLKDSDAIIIGENGYSLVDFFHLEVGNLSFQIKGKGNVTVRVGETPEEALNTNEKLFEQHAIPPFDVSEEGAIIHMPERAFRYVSFECNKGAEISSIEFNVNVWPVEYQMQFESDDDYINNLFKMGRATLHTSMHRFYLDGVKRDFLPWAMDAIVSTLAGDYLFGDQQVSKNGISISLMPLDPQKSDLGVSDYPLHALVGFRQNYMRFGDLETSLQYKDRIIQLLEFYSSSTDKNGFLPGHQGSAGYIPGWATKNGPEGKGIASYAQIMLYYNYMIGADFAELWKEKSLAKELRNKAQILKTKIFEHFWDSQKKAFINGTYNNGKPDTRISHHAQYWAILAGLFPEKDYDNLFENILPHIPHYYNDISYEKGYELLAYAKARRIKEMWKLIYCVFGDWMDQGHSRFPENFSPKASRNDQLKFYGRPYGLSLCHGANGVPPIIGIINGLLGFSQSPTKINEYTIQPELLHLNWIDTRIPVKEGYITLALRSKGESKINIPAGCTVNVINKNGNPSLKLKKAGIYKFKLYHNE